MFNKTISFRIEQGLSHSRKRESELLIAAIFSNFLNNCFAGFPRHFSARTADRLVGAVKTPDIAVIRGFYFRAKHACIVSNRAFIEVFLAGLAQTDAIADWELAKSKN
jgi:hypothetical protein